ncbi:uncharacterized protein LTR77_001615 [Saxophila tyrrhenica]|uniref:Zn(2)-C6 fungal-type domain-containing protein n=1 Tax=Saxophila tyrrhenica TaxID=1690608 RepID=A0AAV9PKS4_9PEZI|nr:hypothetical protein LTR77_001615 [Saxophila tyrrhenica]
MAGQGRRRRNVGVCVECRQHKLKCDTEETHPAPCSRCRAKNLDCAIDATFKRTPARQRARDMAAELERLRRERTCSQHSHSPDALPLVENPICNGESALDNRLVRLDTSAAGIQPARLGLSTFNESAIRERFRMFYDHFHPCLPILSPNVPIGTLQRHSPFLFWTIIAVTCRLERLPEQEIASFESSYTSLAQKASMTSPMTLYTIQALLLICTWPLTARFQLGDPSYLYCSAAIAGAGFLNLDRLGGRPSRNGRQMNKADTQSMSRTWLGLFCVAPSLELWYGTPRSFPALRDLNTISIHIERSEIPIELGAEATMISIGARHKDLLSSNANIAELDNFLQLQEAEVDKMATQCVAFSSPRLQFIALATKFQLLTASLTKAGHGGCSADVLVTPHRLDDVITVSSHMLDTYSTILHDHPGLDSVRRFRTLPKSYHRIHAEQSRQHSRQIITRMRDLYQSCSENVGGPLVGDEPGRAVQCLTVLLDGCESDLDYGKNERDDFQASSLFWNMLQRAYRLRRRSKADMDKASQPRPPVNAVAGNADPCNAPSPPIVMNEVNNSGLLGEAFNDNAFSNTIQDLPDFDWIWGQPNGLDAFNFV